VCVRVARWALALKEFRYTIEHRPGKNMIHVDALSRNSLPTCLVVDECEESLLVRLRRTQGEDKNIRKIAGAEQELLTGYILKNGILYKEIDGDARVVVPESMQMQVIRREAILESEKRRRW